MTLLYCTIDSSQSLRYLGSYRISSIHRSSRTLTILLKHTQTLQKQNTRTVVECGEHNENNRFPGVHRPRHREVTSVADVYTYIIRPLMRNKTFHNVEFPNNNNILKSKTSMNLSPKPCKRPST